MNRQYILQVNELTKKVKFSLESEFQTVWLTGEISNFVAASSGHWYLSLKDQKAQVRCAMFKGSNTRVRIKPKNGQQVLVRAKVTLYEPRGDFQLIIEQMEEEGDGLLKQEYEKLKATLNAQGLFSSEHKKRLPKTVNTVGVVTSPTGAAIKDILSVLARRAPHTSVVIYPALVQGKEAKHEIVSAINIANERAECDVLIVSRGGGSLEDLWSFNEESVVNAIYNSDLPVVCGVGHEIDTTLSDYVADVRAPTPSAAAELISSDIEALITKHTFLSNRLFKAHTMMLSVNSTVVKQLAHRLSRVHPEQQLMTQQQRADELSSRLLSAIEHRLAQIRFKPALLTQRVNQAPLIANIDANLAKANNLSNKLQTIMTHKLANQQQSFVNTIEQLQLVSPLATIARGYSVVRKNNNIVNTVEQLNSEDTISVQMKDGEVAAKVTKVIPANPLV